MFLSRVKRLVDQSSVRLALSLVIVFLIATTLAGVLTFLLVQRDVNRMAASRLVAQATLLETAILQGQPLPQPALGQYYLIISDTGTSGHLPFDVSDLRDGQFFWTAVGGNSSTSAGHYHRAQGSSFRKTQVDRMSF